MGVAHHQSLRAPPTLRLHQRLRGLCGELTGEATGEPPLACTFGGAQLARLDWQHHASGESRGWREAQPGAVCTGRAGGRRVHARGDSTAHCRLRVRAGYRAGRLNARKRLGRPAEHPRGAPRRLREAAAGVHEGLRVARHDAGLARTQPSGCTAPLALPLRAGYEWERRPRRGSRAQRVVARARPVR